MAEKFKWHLYLIVTGLTFLLVIDFFLQVSLQNFIFPDSTTYFAAAQQLYHHFEVNNIRPGLIAAINGFPLVFGFSDNTIFGWSIVVNTVCWLSVVLMLFEILKSFLSEKVAFLFALCYLLCVGSAILIYHLLAESVFTFFLFLTVFLLKKYTDTQKFLYLSLSLSALIASMLIKPAGKILIILAVLYFARTLLKNWRNPAMGFIYLSVAILLVQMGMMKSKFGDFTVSYIDSFTYYNYLGTRADCLKTGETFEQCNNDRYVYFNTLSYADQKKAAFDDISTQLQHNTLNFIKAYVINVWVNSTMGSSAVFECRNVTGTGYFETVKFIFKAMAKVQILFFSFFGFLLSVYWIFKARGKDIFLTAVSVTALYVIGISGISSDQGDRFHVVIYPLVVLLLAKFVADKTKLLN